MEIFVREGETGDTIKLSSPPGGLASKEHKGHKVVLKNKETGEEIARSPRGAASKGIILPKDFEELTKQLALGQKPPPQPKSPPPPAQTEKPVANAGKAVPTALVEEEEEEDEKEKKDEHTTVLEVVADGIFETKVTLPANAFTLFNLAKACGLEKEKDKTFDEWLWDCIRRRFATDYKMQLVMAPIEED